MKRTLALLFLFPLIVMGQQPDHVYQPNIHSVKLYKSGDIYSYPVMMLNSNDQLELHFDDTDADIKNYYYSFQLCNADWTAADIQTYDYIRGFQTNRISTYRNSSLVYTRYTHYQAMIPERNSSPTRSGNYLLKVFLDDDTTQMVFTKRFLIVDNKTSIAAQVQQPYGGQLLRTHQRLQVGINTSNARINTFSPQDLKVLIVQNNVWADALLINRPTIFRGNYLEYSDDATTFPAGKEWRWIDMRSLRLMSDRMQSLLDTGKRVEVFVKPDGERRQQVYVYYRDLDGLYTIENIDGNNPYWQSDYAHVHFSFFPAGNRPYAGKNLYLFGELTNYSPDESSRMIFNEEKGAYEKTLFLKQGYYNYSYITLPDKKSSTNEKVSFEYTEGNYWGTENSYMVLLYYRPFGARADELIGFTKLSSVFQR